MKKVVIATLESSKYVVFVSGPNVDDATLGIGTFIPEGFARGQLDLVVAQAVLGPGLVDDLVDLLPLAELAEVAVRHSAAVLLYPVLRPYEAAAAHRFAALSGRLLQMLS